MQRENPVLVVWNNLICHKVGFVIIPLKEIIYLTESIDSKRIICIKEYEILALGDLYARIACRGNPSVFLGYIYIVFSFLLATASQIAPLLSVEPSLTRII